MVYQAYTANVMDESVLKGNTAILKCHIPSFVSDYVFVVSWLQDDGHEVLADGGSYGASIFPVLSFRISYQNYVSTRIARNFSCICSGYYYLARKPFVSFLHDRNLADVEIAT